MADVVTAGLRALDDLHALDPDVTSGALGRALRALVARHQHQALPGPDHARTAAVIAAVRVAAAHLDAENLIDARQALAGAHEALPSSHGDPAEGTADADETEVVVRGSTAHARAVSDAHVRAMSAQAVIQQAAGVLATHGDTSPRHALALLHRHAERRRFVVSELAADIVAGRVAPQTVMGSAAHAVTA